jgi:hypothetical protein
MLKRLKSSFALQNETAYYYLQDQEETAYPEREMRIMVGKHCHPILILARDLCVNEGARGAASVAQWLSS